jgi:tetratricopeptide (TPR) repeat protein
MRGDLTCSLLLACAALTVGASQLPLREASLRVKETSDAYLLPPPEHLVVTSLGYRAALADLLWANVLVTQGLRLQQRRRYETVGNYLDAIIELDPKWREPYRLSDTLLTFQAAETPIEDVYHARAILERGVRERPLDAELWLQLGQFVAFIAAPSYLKDPEETERWRREGAVYLTRAAEMGAADTSIQWQALGAGGILSRAGERDAAIRFFRRTLASTEDEELREWLLRQLAALESEAEREAYEARREAFVAAWRRTYPGRSVDFVMAAGHLPDPGACAGGARSAAAGSERCASSWAAWAERAASSRR